MPPMSPEERAVEAYKSGDEHRVKGKKLEEEALRKTGADAEKTTAKAKSEFEKSLKDFKNAAKLNPELFQAYNGMGYAYRKTGDYAKALENVRPGDQAGARIFSGSGRISSRSVPRAQPHRRCAAGVSGFVRGRSQAGRHPDGCDEELGGCASGAARRCGARTRSPDSKSGSASVKGSRSRPT